jgi:hypothetical protein
MTFLEQKYRIELDAYEMGVDHLDDLTRIAPLVRTKMEAHS